MPRNPATTTNEERIEGPDGLRIFVRSWRPNGPARGVVVIVPGFNSHSGRYGWVGEQFASTGLAAYALDLRGRGQSDGERFYVEEIADYASDVGRVVALVESREPGLPVFLLGHNAGGVACCLYILEHQAELAGFISESFAFEVPAPEFVLAVLKGLSHLAPHTRVLRLENEDFSRDPEVVKSMNEDPLIADEVEPTETVAAMVRADERLRKEFPRITLPVLILHGSADRATKASGSQLFYRTVGSEDKTLKLYEGHYHDLLNDLHKKKVMADIESWIVARLPSAAERKAAQA